jgi:signal transduction histidine kinase/DNA-binding NarL/FixJ family response regulator
MMTALFPQLARLLGLLLGLGWIPLLQAQTAPLRSDPEQGRPPTRTWTMRDYAAFSQNWAVRTDAEGRLYFGNRDGVLTYDGKAWKLLPMPGVFIRGIGFDPMGRLYAAGIDELGYFERNRLGEWGPYVSLLPHLPPESRTMGDIRQLYVLPDGVYFSAAKHTFRWRDGAFKVWHHDGEANTYAFLVDQRVHLHRHGEALLAVDGDAVVPVLDHPAIREQRLAAVARLGPDQLLLAWSRTGIVTARAGQLTPWAPEWQEWFRTQGVSRVKVLAGGWVAIMTEFAGIGLFTQDGELIQILDRKSGLYNTLARDAQFDSEGGLWLALNHGVAHVDLGAGFSLFDALNGLPTSTVRSIARLNGTLYVATAEGIYRLIPAQRNTAAHFEPLPGSKTEFTFIHAHRSGLIAATRDALVLISPDGQQRTPLTPRGGSALTESPRSSDTLWIASGRGAFPLHFRDGRWIAGAFLPGPEAEVTSIVEGRDGTLWGGTPTRGVLRWRPRPDGSFEEAEALVATAGLPAEHGWVRVVLWRDQVHVSGRGGIFRWDDAAGAFSPFPFQPAPPPGNPTNLYGGDPHHLWSSLGEQRHSVRIHRIEDTGTYQSLPQPLVQAMGDIYVLFRESRNGQDLLWVGGSFGLARVDLARELSTRSDFAAVLSEIGRNRDPDWGGTAFVWPHGQADLDFNFTATTYRSGPLLQFQNRLEGYDPDWLPWSSSSSRSFTNLASGDYRLRVRARDADGRIGREATLSFQVTPPWWQTRWAFAGYGGFSFVALWGFVRWRVHASERERLRLQQLVAERTSQLAESERTLLQAKEAAEAANRAKSAFLASMSHELRTPLNSVLGYAQILSRSSELGAVARRRLDAIRRSGDHLLNLINEVLDLAKVESGRIELVPAPFDLGRFAQSVSESFAQRAADKDLEFITPDLTTVATTVQGDEPRLRQILLNLLGNAFKFTTQGRVAWSLTRIAGDRVRIEVVDTGIGIPPAEQAKIFQPFYQAAGEPDLSRQGTGLGLSISTHLVQLMGGQLQVQSEPGRGSRFWFEVPLPALDAADATDAAAAETGAYIVGYRGRPRRVLVVDDERTNREILIEMLEPLGFLIEEAANASEARAVMARQVPDVVLLDLRMPGDDGFVLAREWRARRTLLGGKVLALSASVLPEQQADAMAAGCDAFLAKPFRVEQLLRVMGSLLQIEWIETQSPRAAGEPSPTPQSTADVAWEAGLLRRLLSLAEHGDALRLGEELAALARQGAQWAAAVAPWQKLAVSYQMEALSRALEQTLRRLA